MPVIINDFFLVIDIFIILLLFIDSVMEYKDYDLNLSADFSTFEKQAKEAFLSEGKIDDKNSEKFKKIVTLYKDLYNEIAIKILIVKLKIDEDNAKNLHKEVWKKLDVFSYNPARMNFVSEYVRILTEFAESYIDLITKEFIESGERLTNMLKNSVFSETDEDKLEYYKKQVAFVWQYISKMENLPKKIFMYKLYGEFSFSDIGNILNMSEQKVKQYYIDAENKLFSDKEFLKFFKL